MKNNFLNSWFKRIVLLTFLVFVFVIICLVINHSFFISTLSSNECKLYYPNYFPKYYSFLLANFGGLIHFIGKNAIVIFYINLSITIVLFFRILYTGLKKKSDFKIYSIVFIFLLVFCELILRIFHFQPGIHAHFKYFKPVSKLWTYKSFVADKDGILRVSSEVGKEVSLRISKNNPNYGKHEYGEIYGLTKEYIDLKHGKTKNYFALFYRQILIKNNKSDLDSAILNYVKNPINSDGFRGIEMRRYKNKKPTVLLLGDSFAWGHSAMPKSNSFADLLLTKGYIVYNTGISATDVAQYLTVAKKYIKKLKPDFVIVNFYIGNDVTYYKRKVNPFQPVFYCTNAGNMYYFYNGQYFKTKREAYIFGLKQMTIPSEVCAFNKVMSKSVITSLCWGIMNKATLISFLNSRHNMNLKYKEPYCNFELKEIKMQCLKNNAKFVLSSIPEIVSSDFKKARDIPDLFRGITYNEMKVSESDYNLEDGHFNIQGHRRYAAFLHRIMKSKTN
jgi:lysophospholipase L1-like esterase